MIACHRLAVVVALALTGLAAHAQSHMRPGLWEQTVDVKSDNAQANAAMDQMKARLAAMPADQRAAMETMMAAHGMGTGGAGSPMTMRVCITKEQAERDLTPDNNGRCTRTNLVRSGNTTKFDFACSGKVNVSGDGMFTQLGDSAFTVSTNATSTMQGAPSKTHTEIAGKFVSSDCGSVKPVETPPAR